jgi:hypothetical protein
MITMWQEKTNFERSEFLMVGPGNLKRLLQPSVFAFFVTRTLYLVCWRAGSLAVVVKEGRFGREGDGDNEVKVKPSHIVI